MEGRTTTFFYLNAVSMVANLSSGPLVYLAMKKGPIVTQCIGICLMSLAFVFTLALPDAQKGKREAVIASSRETTSASFRQMLSLITTNARQIFFELFWNNLQLGFLLASQLLTTIGGQEVSLRLQYVTKRYGWTWGEVSCVA